MKKIFTAICIMLSVGVSAVTVNDVTGTFKGMLLIDDEEYPNEKIYILPGTESNTITFVLPDFKFNGAPLGDIVLVNVPMNNAGKLTIDKSTVYIKSIRARAAISSTGSTLSSSSAQIGLKIDVASVPLPIPVTFSGGKAKEDNYAITNGGFEGSWTNNEPQGWHSFVTATGDYASFVAGNTDQFQQSTDKRPGSAGSYSAQIQSKITLGVKANGNCTNGRINAGSMSATDASGNYAFSDPSQTNYNTPFVGCPDSLVFWAKYVPGGGSVSDASNKARAHATLLTNARYQDPETGDYSAVKIAEATSNYSATSSKGWQRISVPFVYTGVDPKKMAYMLLTFTTNATPGGGNATKKSPDNVYIDDAEMVYNHALSSLQLDGSAVSFSNGQTSLDKLYSDSAYLVSAKTNGKAAKSFIGYDAKNFRMYVYVVADNYSQSHAYSLYTVQMTEPIKDTEYAYAASTCDNEPYSDNLFQNLTKSGEYKTTIPNKQGGDSLITLTLSVLPTYTFAAEEAVIKMNESYEWHGKTYRDLVPGAYTFPDSLTTKAGCDSVYTLRLRVEAIDYQYEETLSACVGEANEWHGKPLPTVREGRYVLYDSLKSVYGMDSVYVLMLQVFPVYLFAEEKYVNEANLEWRGKTIQNLPQREEPYLIYDSLSSIHGCDSVYLLRLHVSDIPITYGYYSDECCGGEFILFDGVEYRESFDGDVRISARNIYGGDSIVHLAITVYPSYYIEEEMTIVAGETRTWEYYQLNQFPEGTITLKAEYWSDDFCDSIRVLHLTVVPEPIETGMHDTRTEQRDVRKVIYNGRLYIIRKDEQIYDLLGNKIH